ncbi:2-amino-4-hydroxy-6-hydroxymethyldihydropteridine diphosphokinase [Neolewinella persica]|uniref:2-amino-4-hydroxy-6- hydroxymethyldihydropteridine diphosphokinase n=1 Tax=Neolewinella persica TaxID=70998 RepID=UPI000379EAE5|nr:2-amino-4-hydroxy-6-hydroxymethyldihydropteridine diphosphokinase [Neolewinella persica]
MHLTIALGANLGDREATLATARQLIQDRIGPLHAVSSLQETPAWGRTDQPDFLNQVVVVVLKEELDNRLANTSTLSVGLHHLLDVVQSIESELGRQRKEHWGPRTCDLDLIFLRDLRFEDERLSLPHPWWRERDFVGGIIRRELGWLLLEYPVGGGHRVLV